MSYSIAEGLKDTTEKAEALSVIAKRYPDATLSPLPNGDMVWTSDAALKDASDVRVVSSKENVFFCPYLIIHNVPVYGRHWWSDARVALIELERKYPGAYDALVRVVREG